MAFPRLPRPPVRRLLGVVATLVLVATLGLAVTRVVADGCDTDAEATAPGGRWCSVYREDFAAAVPEGAFVTERPDHWVLATSSPYARSLRSYPDGWGTTHDRSLNFASRTASVLPEAYGASGVLQLRVRSEEIGGRAASLAGSLFPVLDPDHADERAQTAQTYGRYTVRFRTVGGYPAGSDPALGQGYGTAFLLWPASETWAEGEVDFPEMAWGDRIGGYVHTIGDPAVNAAAFTTETTTDADWVTARLDWSPGLLRFWINGVQIAHTTESVPSTPFRWGFQSGGMNATPHPETAGSLLVDWIAIDAYVPD